MKPLTRLLSLGLALEALSLSAPAIMISLQPTAPVVGPGDTVLLTLLVSGTTGFGSPSLAGYDFDFSYDPTILTPESVVFGTYLNTIPGMPQQYFDPSSPGLLHLDEVSFESSAFLDGNQPDSFTLATLAFRGLSPGDSAVAFVYAALSDADGNAPSAFDVEGARVTVTSARAVADTGPGVALLGTALAGVAALIRSTPRRSQA